MLFVELPSLRKWALSFFLSLFPSLEPGLLLLFFLLASSSNFGETAANAV